MTKGFQRPKGCGIGACVEVAIDEQQVSVRDSKQGEDGAVLTFDQAEWRAFITAAKAGQYDA